MNSGVRVVGFGKCSLVNTAYKKDDLFSDHSCIIGLVWMDNIRKKQLKQICFVINKRLEIKEHAAVPYTALHKEFQHKQNFSCSTRSCSNHSRCCFLLLICVLLGLLSASLVTRDHHSRWIHIFYLEIFYVSCPSRSLPPEHLCLLPSDCSFFAY